MCCFHEMGLQIDGFRGSAELELLEPALRLFFAV